MAAMDGLERLLRWVGLRPDPSTHEPADMGTAFGMEMSFDDDATGQSSPDTTPSKTPPRRGDA